MGRRITGTGAAMAGMRALALVSVAAFAQTNLTDLGAVAPGLGVNNSGQVVLQNYFYSNGTLTAFPANFTGAGINGSGQVVGTYIGQPGSCPTPPGANNCIAVCTNGILTLYPSDQPLPHDGVANHGLSINSSGQIVGYWFGGRFDTGAILFSNGVFSNLSFPYPPGGTCPNPYAGTEGPPNYAYGINDAGQIAGTLGRITVGGLAFCLEAFLLSQGVYTDIGTGTAFALNANAQVVGELQFGSLACDPPNTSAFPIIHAFIYNGSGSNPAQDLGALPGGNNSHAYAINSQSLVVGASSFNPGFDPASACPGTFGPVTNAAAFFYNGVMIDLNTFVSANDPLKPFVTLTDARGINDSGLIIVNGVDSRTQAQHAYLVQAPLIQVAPGPLSFPSEPIGSQSPPQTATFTNVGTTAIALSAASISTDFVIQTNSCGAALGPAAQCAITVVFAPTGAGSPSGTLTLIAGGVPIAVPLLSALSVSITATSTTATTATGVTVTWSATTGTSCTATGGSAADGWVGNVPTSGSRSVKEATPGTYTYGISCTAGPQTQTAQAAAVVVSWAPVTVTVTASPTTLYTGQSTTLTWSSKNATKCASSGGGSNDGWPNSSRPASGSVPITEPNPVITGGSEILTFTLTCTSSLSNLSGTSSVQVVQLDTPPPSKGGGGGAFDLLALVFLLGVLAAQARRSTPLHARALHISAGTDWLKRNQTN